MLNVKTKRGLEGKYDVSGINVEDLVAQIEVQLGEGRRRKLERDPEAYSDFWYGVLVAIPKATKTADPIPYLICKGYYKIVNERKSRNRHSYVAYCPECGRYWSFTKGRCPKCGGGMEYLNRVDEDAMTLASYDRESDLQMSMEQFVSQLADDRDRYIAKRWMLDRADVLERNYCKQLAYEMGLKPSTVANRITKLKSAFAVWYNG